jgi:hypothetical protein
MPKMGATAPAAMYSGISPANNHPTTSVRSTAMLTTANAPT